MRATKDVIAPLTVGLLGMVVLPAAALWGITRIVTLPIDGDFLCESTSFLYQLRCAHVTQPRSLACLSRYIHRRGHRARRARDVQGHGLLVPDDT